MKNVDDFKQYVKKANVKKGTIALSAYHRHTHTEVHFDLVQTK